MMDVFSKVANTGCAVTPEAMQLADAFLQEHLDKPNMHYVSKNPQVYKAQQRVMARHFMAKEAALLQPKSWDYQPEQTPEEIEREVTASIIHNNHVMSAALMGSDSIYNAVSLWDPAIEQTDIIRFVRDDLPQSGKRNALLLGGTGCGKTYAAIGYIVQWLEQYSNGYITGEFITAYRVSVMISCRKFDDLERLERVKYLVVDDLGTEPEGYRGKDFIAHLEHLFIERHQHNRPTIFTSNATLQDFMAAYGERFLSRFRESGVVFESSAPDMRSRKNSAAAQ